MATGTPYLPNLLYETNSFGRLSKVLTTRVKSGNPTWQKRRGAAVAHSFREPRNKMAAMGAQAPSGSMKSASIMKILDSASILPGNTSPLGPSPLTKEIEGKQVDGVNFAVFAGNATAVTLVIFGIDGKEITKTELFSSDDGVWHGFLPDLPHSNILYGLYVAGHGGWETPFRWDSSRILLDPYAPLVVGRAKFGVRDDFEQFESPVS